MRSASGAACIGVPKLTSTTRPRVRLGQGCGSPTEAIRWQPQSATGTTGTWVSRASAAVPRISARTVNEWLIPASGNEHTASPSSSSRRASRNAPAGARRSTGTWRIRSRKSETTGTQASYRVMKRT